jgi:uncharacterized protein (DUF2249 family)
MSTCAVPSQQVDIRPLDGCVARKAHVLSTFDYLEDGESVVIINDHLPRGLWAHLQEQRPGLFDWTMLESGPEVFRVLITRVGRDPRR